jgi:hypothetical protein
MKNIFKSLKYLGFSAAFTASLVACDTNFEEINTDPNKPNEVPTSYLLTSSQKQLMDEIWDEWNNGRFGLMYSQYWSQVAYSEESRYQFRTSTVDAFWKALYSGADNATNGGGMRNIEEIILINKAKIEASEDEAFKAQLNNQIAVARIMKAWIFQMMTDIWGDIPYSGDYNGDNAALKNEALKDEITHPVYDSQKEIYHDLLQELKEAAAQIDADASGFAGGDLYYNGDMDNWKKLANSLRLRVAMRMADVDADGKAEAAVRELAADPSQLIASNSQNAVLAYLSGSPNNNPLNEAYKTRIDFAVSATLTDKLKDLSDPRLSIFAAPAPNGGYHGVTYGLAAPEDLNPDTYSLPSDAVIGATAPGIIMNYAEVEFLLAEAAERYSTGSAEAHFKAGVKASLNEWGVAAGDIAAYMANISYDAANWKQSIGTQKWLALYMQGVQGWTEWRRLDFGVLQMPADGILSSAGTTVIPTRLVYPISEQQLNNKQYIDALAAQGISDSQGEKLWWDVN